MINDCLTGRIDLIITKSISRFARNALRAKAAIKMPKGLKKMAFLQQLTLFSTACVIAALRYYLAIGKECPLSCGFLFKRALPLKTHIHIIHKILSIRRNCICLEADPATAFIGRITFELQFFKKKQS